MIIMKRRINLNQTILLFKTKIRKVKININKIMKNKLMQTIIYHMKNQIHPKKIYHLINLKLIRINRSQKKKISFVNKNNQNKIALSKTINHK